MSEPDPQTESVREGWLLGKESWGFYRAFYRVVGRPTRWGEDEALLIQIRHGVAKPIGRQYWRVTLLDGTPITVRGGWNALTTVESADFMPTRLVADHPPLSPKQLKALAARTLAERAAKKAAKKAAKATQDAAAPPPPPVVPPPPSKPLRASTLTLGNPAAAQVLAARMRRFGVPPPGSPS